MARIKQGILGAFSGKVGSVVGSSWKGIPIMKSLPPSVANPKTAGQVTQRAKMSNCVAAAKSILAVVIKPLNDRFVSRMSGYNDFVKRNISLFDSTGLVTPENFQISQSRNKAQLIDALSPYESTQRCDFTWDSDEGEGFALPNDKPFVVIHNRNTKLFYGFAILDERQNESCSASLPAGSLTTGDVVDGYLAFLRLDGTVVFGTAYATATVLAAP